MLSSAAGKAVSLTIRRIFMVRAREEENLTGERCDAPQRPAMPPGAGARVGTKLGKYLVQRLIGAGGMGAVYEALDSFLKRRVAIKVLPDSTASSAEAVR